MILLSVLLSCAHKPTPKQSDDTSAVEYAPQTGVLDESFTDDAGATGELRIIVPQDITPGAYGVLLFFGWDGGDSYYQEEADLHEALAAEHDLLVVSMATPVTDSASGCWWAPAVEDNAAYVAQFVADRLVGELRIDPDRVFLTGLSGGADFAAAFHYHTGFAYRGGSVALCGGDLPRLNGGNCGMEIAPPEAPAPEALSAEVRSGIRYDFALTADDYLFGNAEEAVGFYTGLGFERVQIRTASGSGHCGFSEGWEGLDTLAEGLDYVDPRVTP